MQGNKIFLCAFRDVKIIQRDVNKNICALFLGQKEVKELLLWEIEVGVEMLHWH